jgi:hypothetical protein
LRWLFRLLLVDQQHAQDASDRAMTSAWLTAMLTRSKKLPALKTLLAQAKVRRDRPQSVGEQRAMLHMLSQQYGIPLRKGKRGR